MKMGIKRKKKIHSATPERHNRTHTERPIYVNQSGTCALTQKQHETKGTARRNSVGGKDSNTQVFVLQQQVLFDDQASLTVFADYNEHKSVISSETNSLYPRCPHARTHQ